MYLLSNFLIQSLHCGAQLQYIQCLCSLLHFPAQLHRHEKINCFQQNLFTLLHWKKALHMWYFSFVDLQFAIHIKKESIKQNNMSKTRQCTSLSTHKHMYSGVSEAFCIEDWLWYLVASLGEVFVFGQNWNLNLQCHELQEMQHWRYNIRVSNSTLCKPGFFPACPRRIWLNSFYLGQFRLTGNGKVIAIIGG